MFTKIKHSLGKHCIHFKMIILLRQTDKIKCQESKAYIFSLKTVIQMNKYNVSSSGSIQWFTRLTVKKLNSPKKVIISL